MIYSSVREFGRKRFGRGWCGYLHRCTEPTQNFELTFGARDTTFRCYVLIITDRCVAGIHASHAPHLLSGEAITRFHEAGLNVILWHEEREEELRCLLDLGVDGICTTDPERLKNLRIAHERKAQRLY